MDKGKIEDGLLRGMETINDAKPSGPARIRNNGKIIRTTSGYAQAGLWASYPGVNSVNRQGTLILERAQLPSGREVLLFGTEESDIPGPRHIDRTLGVVAPMPEGTKSWAFTSHRVNVLEEAYGLRGVKPDTIGRIEVDVEGHTRLDKVLKALGELDAEEPNDRRYRAWVKRFAECAWGEGDRRVEGDDDKEFLNRVYRKMFADNPNQLWALWARGQGIAMDQTPTEVAICTHWLPQEMFEALCRAADQGWTPILPQWQTVRGYMYNHDWNQPCMGNVVPRYADGSSLTYPEMKFLASPAMAGYTIHWTGSHSNPFDYYIPDRWIEMYMAVLAELGATKAPVNDYPMMEGMLREAALTVPTMVIGSDGDISLYELTGKITRDAYGEQAATVAGKCLGMLEHRERAVAIQPTNVAPMLTEDMLNQAFRNYMQRAGGLRNLWAEALGVPGAAGPQAAQAQAQAMGG